MAKLIDLTGQTFHRLKVLERAEDYVDGTDRKYVRWKCECQCQDKTVIYVLGDNLRNGNVKSCGCLRVENMSKIRNEMCNDNVYDLSGEYGIGYTTNTNLQFLFDLEDYEAIANYRWYEHKGYIRGTMKDGKSVDMQNLIMNPSNTERVDHIKHKTWDNRKSQLRIGTISDNNSNRVISKTNTSGIPGVSWHKTTKKWAAYISKNHKRIYLGEYDDKNDAVKARKEAEAKYFGEWAYDASIERAEQYKIEVN